MVRRKDDRHTIIDRCGLDRSLMVEAFAKPQPGRKTGAVTLTPSFVRCKDWEGYGSIIADANNIYAHVEQLKGGNRDQTLVIANRYDGIDAPRLPPQEEGQYGCAVASRRGLPSRTSAGSLTWSPSFKGQTGKSFSVRAAAAVDGSPFGCAPCPADWHRERPGRSQLC